MADGRPPDSDAPKGASLHSAGASLHLAEWLQLREPADHAARSTALTRSVADSLPVDGPVQVLDLATGTGSNVRYLMAHLPRNQRWLVADRSPELLSLQLDRAAAWASTRGHRVHADANGFRVTGEHLDCHVETLQRDLGALDDGEMFAGRHLVTASALLDLVSEPWLRSLAARCSDVAASVLFALTYNGQSTCAPVEDEDELIRDLLNRHQKTDKGLGGPAAGPDAVTCAERCFTDMGYRVRVEASDWELAPADRELQRQLIDGWADAARERAPDLTSTIASWQRRRMAHLDAGQSRIIVRHHDLAAWPPVRP